MNGADDHYDALLEALLAEELGGESPPDLTERILARTWPAKKPLIVRFAYVSLAAAAAAVLVVTAWLLLAERYPAPNAAGGCVIADGGPLRRGAAVRTGAESAVLNLGGYCRVEMRPASALRIEGVQWAEQVRLTQGEVLCQVVHGKGSFVVQTDVGSVRVTGTKFITGIREDRGIRRMFVQVLDGSVMASGQWGDRSLRAGEVAMLPPRPASATGNAPVTGPVENTSTSADPEISPEFHNLIDAYQHDIQKDNRP